MISQRGVRAKGHKRYIVTLKGLVMRFPQWRIAEIVKISTKVLGIGGL